VSQFILLKEEELHTKMVAGSPLFFPKVAILDSLLLKGLPFGQFVTSGVDALGHAMEAYWATFATPITDALALQAVGMIYQNLRPAATTDDLNAKEACLIASTMANIACGNARLGLAHSMSSPMEATFKIPHGIAVGILLPHVMEFNLPASYQRFAALARAMGENDTGKSIYDMAPLAITCLKRLLVDLGFPRKFSALQADRKNIPGLAKIVMGGPYGVFDPNMEYPMNAPVPTFNIRKATMDDLIRLYEKAFEGWEL
jgi:alcohol dehydrogenase class IV